MWYVFNSNGGITSTYKYNMERIFNIKNIITANTIALFSRNIVSSITTGEIDHILSKDLWEIEMSLMESSLGLYAFI